MAKIALPYTMEQDRIANIKANSVHVDANFNTLLQAVNNKIDRDGTIVPSANLSMGNNKIVGLATPTNSGDATTKGYVDALITELRTSIAQANSAINTNLENLKALYPIGSVYIGTQNECPMTTLIPDSEWRLVSSGRALWTGNGSNGNNTIEAGLPNITASWGANYDDGGEAQIAIHGKYNSIYTVPTTGGATISAISTSGSDYTGGGSAYRGIGGAQLNFDASRSNNTYGKSSTVQPPAYIVNVWRRTA